MMGEVVPCQCALTKGQGQLCPPQDQLDDLGLCLCPSEALRVCPAVVTQVFALELHSSCLSV